MAGMGPAPKHPSARARRNAAPSMTLLPAEGRQGPVPEWPLPSLGDEDATHELGIWADIWATPQAVQWERLGWTRDVAQYVRFKAQAELGDLNAAREARQWSDRLGLSPLALLRLRWEIASTEVEEPVAKKGTPKRSPKGDDPRLVLVQ